MGTVSLVLGIISLIIGFIPLCGAIALMPAIIGIILGIIDIIAKNKKGEKKGISIAGLVLSAIATATIIFWVFVFGMSGDTNNASTQQNSLFENSTTQEIEYISLDVDQLDDDLNSNAAAAKDKYNGKYLEITGRLGVIDSDLKYISLLSTTDSWDLIGIHCSVKNNEQREVIKNLTKDDTIVVKGKVTDVGEVLGYYLDIIEITN